MAEYLTTQEVADLLRIKQRKVYDLVAKGQIPYSRAMGKLLFPKHQIDDWVAGGLTKGDKSPAPAAETATKARPSRARPNVFLGSHDPLLDWALRESRSGLATFFDGSGDGLDRFENLEGVATGLHTFDPKAKEWNLPTVRDRFARAPVALVEFARRDRGLICRADRVDRFKTAADLRGRLIVPRQKGAGSQTLLEHLLKDAKLGKDDYVMAEPALTETDAAETVAGDLGEVTLGLRAAADRLNLGFVLLMQERFDILVDRRAWFDPPMQKFLAFCRTDAFTRKANAMGGYDVSGLGAVRFNGS
ncbi:MAG: helix-turn-helix transcriptional regulator [Rhodospirillaceae bacterium]